MQEAAGRELCGKYEAMARVTLTETECDVLVRGKRVQEGWQATGVQKYEAMARVTVTETESNVLVKGGKQTRGQASLGGAT